MKHTSHLRGVLLPAFVALTLGLPQSIDAKKKVKKAKVEAVKPDTASINDFSYAFGVANTQGLKTYLVQRENVDTAFIDDFVKGLNVTTESDADKRLRAYLAGINIRQQLETSLLPRINQQVSGNDSSKVINKDLFLAGFLAAVQGNPTLAPDSAQALVQKNLNYYEERNMLAKHGDWKKQNEEYLVKNAKADSVQTTASGLQYKVITKGTGAIPTATQTVKVNYEGKLIDGTVFDSSYKRKQPATFGCGQVIKGWTEALTMMPVGSKWELYIPQTLGYGSRETGKIKPFSTLVFTVELLEITK